MERDCETERKKTQEIEINVVTSSRVVCVTGTPSKYSSNNLLSDTQSPGP